MKKAFAICLVVAALVGGHAKAAMASPPPTPGREAKITKPAWIAVPSWEDILAIYPEERLERGGLVAMSCLVNGQGELASCAVVSAIPSKRFGAAALQLAPRYRMMTIDGDGRRVEGRPVEVFVVFRVPG